MKKITSIALTTICLQAWSLLNAPTAQAAPAANPVLRLESDSGVATDAFNNVSSWTDQSGSSHDATQGDPAAKPILFSNVFNGLPGLRFDGSTSFLNVAGTVLTSQQFSIFAVVTDTGTDFGFREIFSNWTGTNSVTSVFLGTFLMDPVKVRFTDNYGGDDDGQTGVGIISTPASPFVLSGVSNSADVAVYQNEDLLDSRNTPLTTRDLTAPYVIGKQGDSIFEFWTGDVGAILVYDRELTNAERIQTTQYLESKFVPEPSTAAMLALGLTALLSFRRRRSA